VAVAPLLAVAAIGIRLTSRGPILFRATRAGIGGAPFTMLKLRTMHVDGGRRGDVITAHDDRRVFAFGAWLRRSKVDELPQLVNVLRGEMAIVGPRPEDPRIVERYYTDADRETLTRLPGLASPGSLYNYTHGERLIGAEDPERDYVERLLPIKLALDRVYVRRATALYDLRIVLRTIGTIASLAAGRRAFAEPPEMAEAMRLLEARGGDPAPSHGPEIGLAKTV
jgi:lipopolysaccharide/colanic/teichoic acid biosynthesis glycosyltransferase